MKSGELRSSAFVSKPLVFQFGCCYFLSLCVRIVSSTRSGMGKSLYISRMADRLRLQCSTRNLSVTIPVHGPVVTQDTVMELLKEHMTNSTSTVFHLDVSRTVRALLWFLFYLLSNSNRFFSSQALSLPYWFYSHFVSVYASVTVAHVTVTVYQHSVASYISVVSQVSVVLGLLVSSLKKEPSDTVISKPVAQFSLHRHNTIKESQEAWKFKLEVANIHIGS